MMSSVKKTSASPNSPYPMHRSVLPPIAGVSSSVDGIAYQEMVSIELSVQSEVSRLVSGESHPRERFMLFREAFNKALERMKVFSPLLTTIKCEYECVVDVLERSMQHAVHLQGKFDELSMLPATKANYEHRAGEVSLSVKRVSEENARLEASLELLQTTRAQRERADAEAEAEGRKPLAPGRQLPGMSVEASANVDALQHELRRVDTELRELDRSAKTGHVHRGDQSELRKALDGKLQRREQLEAENETLRATRRKMEAAMAALRGQTEPTLPRKTAETPSEGADEWVEQPGSGDAEDILEAIGKFNELFEADRFVEAASHAANSPRGVLVSCEVLHKFKGVHSSFLGKSPALLYSEAIMASVEATARRPDEKLSLECVRVALNEEQLQLVAHWIARNWLTVSEPLGTLVQDYAERRGDFARGGLAIAQSIYRDAEAYRQAALCMLKQGKLLAAIEFARKTARFSKDDYVFLVQRCPSAHLARALVTPQEDGHSLLSIGCVLTAMLVSDCFEAGLVLLTSLTQGDATRIRETVLQDSATSAEQWIEIARAAAEIGYSGVADEVTAAMREMDMVKRTLMSRNDNKDT